MIAYNPKEWFTFIFRLHKADTIRQLFPLIVGISLYTVLVAVIDIHFLHLDSQSVAAKIAVMHSLLGFVISLLLVFRTNTAYERWWEGRKLWGSLINCSRNLAIKSSLLATGTDRMEFKKLIEAFPFALKNHLRNSASLNEIEIAEVLVPHALHSAPHVPMKISMSFYSLLVRMGKSGTLNTEQMLLLNGEAQQWMEICGACERIRNTPIPFSYSVFLKKFIFFYVMTLPLAYVPVLGYYSIPIVIFIFYVLASLELIAEEIENPFGNDANDLPLDAMARTIRGNVELIFNEGHEVAAR